MPWSSSSSSSLSLLGTHSGTLHPAAAPQNVGFGPNSLFAFALGKVQGDSNSSVGGWVLLLPTRAGQREEGQRGWGIIPVTPLATLCCSFPRAGLRTGAPWAGAQIAQVCLLGGVCFIPYRDYELLSPGLWAWSTRGRNWGLPGHSCTRDGGAGMDVPCAPPWTWPSSSQGEVGGCTFCRSSG